MTPETETESTSAVSNVGDGSDVAITCASDTMRKSSASNRIRGRGLGGRTRRGGHRVSGGIGIQFNRPEYTQSTRKLKVEVEYFGAVLWTTAKQRESKY